MSQKSTLSVTIQSCFTRIKQHPQFKGCKKNDVTVLPKLWNGKIKLRISTRLSQLYHDTSSRKFLTEEKVALGDLSVYCRNIQATVCSNEEILKTAQGPQARTSHRTTTPGADVLGQGTLWTAFKHYLPLCSCLPKRTTRSFTPDKPSFK